MKGDPETDPKGLIYEAYRIENITPAECRTIFLDWALSMAEGADTRVALEKLIVQYGAGSDDHPMTAVLTAGLDGMATPRRRGGWRSRPRS